MTMRTAKISVVGVSPLLQNNPQTVDRFNAFAKRMKAINDKKTRRTDDDYKELSDIEIRSKIYFDDTLGVYIPASWIMQSLALNGFKVAKLGKDSVRGGLFTTEDKIKLTYQDMDKVVAPDDIVGNPFFRLAMTLKQGSGKNAPRVVKALPIFHKWSFATTVEFDDKIIDPESLTRIAAHAGRYDGYGDFRPTFGRAIAEVQHV